MKNIKEMILFYEKIIVENLRFMLDRYDFDYGFIDTKFKIFYGKDFCQISSGNDIYSQNVIYSYVQGRALESLAEHCYWFERCHNLALCDKIKEIIPQVINKMESARCVNNGRVYFMMSPEGTPLKMTDNGEVVPQKAASSQVNFSDIFYAKGLYAAAKLLKNQILMLEAENYCKEVAEAIFSGNSISGSQSFDIKNLQSAESIRISHGPFMLLIGMTSLFKDNDASGYWTNVAEQAIKHIIEHHINIDSAEYCEFVTSDGVPLQENGVMICDPGHAMEFIGLSCKVLDLFPGLRQLRNDCQELFPRVFRKTFDIGFNHKSGGFYKTVDLRSRKSVNSEMPWWSIPETIRAATLLSRINPETLESSTQIIKQCDKAFRYYIRPEFYLLPYQTRNALGKPIDTIPAVPDADPCYHTGLSLIDALTLLAKTLNPSDHSKQALSQQTNGRKY